MARTQKNKATAGHLGLLKARLAKLRRELITPKGGGGGPGEGFDVAKTGDARVGFVGFPSVGKSTLLSTLAGVYSEVAAYEFTTLTTVPGCIKYKGAKIQVRCCDDTYWCLICNFFSCWTCQELLKVQKMVKVEVDR